VSCELLPSDAICHGSAIRAFTGDWLDSRKLRPALMCCWTLRSLSDIERMVLNDEADIGLIPLSSPAHRAGLFAVCTLTPVTFTAVAHIRFSNAKPSPQLRDQILSSKVVHAGIHTSPWWCSIGGYEQGGHFLFLRSTACDDFCPVPYIGFMPDAYVQRHVEAGDLCALVPETKQYSLEVCAITRTHTAGLRERGNFFLSHWMIA